jgi:mycofactocin system transcriptional regulator
MALSAEVKGLAEISARQQAKHGSRVGRRPVTSRAELERIALELFAINGFEETSVDDIATAAGVGRRTVFRYFPSKNDMVWGEFDRELDRLRAWFEACPDDVPLMEAIRRGVVAFNEFPADVEPSHRRRMTLILTTPALQAHSTLRYAEWRAVVAEFAARRVGAPPDELLPRLVGHLSLGAAVAAYEQWLHDPGSDLGRLLDQSLSELARGFTPTLGSTQGRPRFRREPTG